MIKGLICDLYGTIINAETKEFDDQTFIDYATIISDEYRIDPMAFKEALTKYVNSMNDPAVDDITLFFQDYFSTSYEKARQLAYKYRVASRYKIEFRKDALETLPELAEKYRMVILSNAQAAFTMPEINLFKLSRFFERIFISSEEKAKKPESSFFEKAIEYLQLKKEEILFIGDQYDTDILGAQKIGLKNALILNPIIPKMQDIEPEFIINDFYELKSLLKFI